MSEVHFVIDSVISKIGADKSTLDELWSEITKYYLTLKSANVNELVEFIKLSKRLGVEVPPKFFNFIQVRLIKQNVINAYIG